MIQDVTRALNGLSEAQIREVTAATMKRVARFARLGAESLQHFAERCLIEYAEEAREGRPLELDQHDRLENTYTRNYLVVYGAPREQ